MDLMILSHQYSEERPLGDFVRQVATGQIHEDWSQSYLKPIPKPGEDHSKLNGYRIITMQNTTGKLMERIEARKLARD